MTSPRELLIDAIAEALWRMRPDYNLTWAEMLTEIDAGYGTAETYRKDAAYVLDAALARLSDGEVRDAMVERMHAVIRHRAPTMLHGWMDAGEGERESFRSSLSAALSCLSAQEET